MRMSSSKKWLVDDWNWPGAAAFCGIVLLGLFPVILPLAGLAVALVFLQMPLYMLHQIEEHSGDRFRLHINSVIGRGREVLTRPATFVINSLGVWGIDFVALYLAVFAGPGWGLMAIYLPLVNAVGHIGEGILRKGYNPGLWTAVFGFLPVAGGSLLIVSVRAGTTWVMQVTGLAVALLVHAAIIVHVKARLRSLAGP